MILVNSVNISAQRPLGSISEIICPLFVAEPNNLLSWGMRTNGSISMVLVKSPAEISGRLGIPTPFRTSLGG